MKYNIFLYFFIITLLTSCTSTNKAAKQLYHDQNTMRQLKFDSGQPIIKYRAVSKYEASIDINNNPTKREHLAKLEQLQAEKRAYEKYKNSAQYMIEIERQREYSRLHEAKYNKK